MVNYLFSNVKKIFSEINSTSYVYACAKMGQKSSLKVNECAAHVKMRCYSGYHLQSISNPCYYFSCAIKSDLLESAVYRSILIGLRLINYSSCNKLTHIYNSQDILIVFI